MQRSGLLRAMMLGLSLTTLSPGTVHAAPRLPGVIMPPVSYPKAQFLRTHPFENQLFLRGLQHPAPAPQLRATRPAKTLAGGSWTAVTEAPVPNITNPVLLTDGTVLVQNAQTPDWYKLTPDSSGSYANGTWTQAASLPVINGTQYAPLYHATAVLPDGRVIIMGGEYNGTDAVWTNLGAIYDPIADSWTPVAPPGGGAWDMIGDAQSVVLPNGQFLLGSCCADPAANAILNASTLTWTNAAAPKFGNGYQDEQGYELLPSGDVLTVDVWTNTDGTNNGNADNAEFYMPKTGSWTPTGTLPVSLADPAVCGTYEIGPAVMRRKSLVAFGGNTGCTSDPTDPTAIYSPKTNSWIQGPDIPAVCGAGSTSCSLADAPAALLPDGSILFAASAGYGDAPTHFFEFTADNQIQQVPDTLQFSDQLGSYYYNFLDLPNGQILMTDFTSEPEVYTPADARDRAAAPSVIDVPTTLRAGKTYKLAGRQLNGISQGAYYGDDAQTSTNFPLVRITNTATGHVVYGRTTNFSYMGVKPDKFSRCDFVLPAAIETGPSTLVIAANGVPSAPVAVTIK